MLPRCCPFFVLQNQAIFTWPLLPRLREVHQRGGRSCQPPVPAKGCPARLFWGSLAPEWGEFTQVALQQLEKKNMNLIDTMGPPQPLGAKKPVPRQLQGMMYPLLVVYIAMENHHYHRVWFLQCEAQNILRE